jgi:hypothetical protein
MLFKVKGIQVGSKRSSGVKEVKRGQRGPVGSRFVKRGQRGQVGGEAGVVTGQVIHGERLCKRLGEKMIQRLGQRFWEGFMERLVNM